MTIESWLQAAIADAERRGLTDLKPLLETLARATTLLREADFNRAADLGNAASGPVVRDGLKTVPYNRKRKHRQRKP